MFLNSECTLQACWSPMGLHRHVGLRWGMLVSDGAFGFPMGLRSGMSVADESPIRHVGLRCNMSTSPIRHFQKKLSER